MEKTRLEILATLAGRLSHSLDSFVVLDAIRDAARNAVHSDHAAAAIVDETSGEFVWASQNWDGRGVEDVAESFELCRQTVRLRKNVRQRLGKGRGCYFVGTPMIAGQSAMGVVSLLRTSAPFGHDEEKILAGIASLGYDALEKTLDHQRLLRNKRAENALFDTIEHGLIGIAGTGKIVVFNKPAEFLTGIASRAVVGKSTVEGLPPPLARVVKKFLSTERRDDRRTIHEDIDLAKPDGTLVQLIVTLATWNSGGSHPGIVLHLKDQRERKAIEQKFQQLDRLMSIGQLVAGVAHELNNPLSTIYGYTQMLLRETHRENCRKPIDAICEEARRATSIVRNLLSFTREHQQERRYLNVNAIVEKVVNFRAYELRSNKIELTIELSPDLPPTMIDPNGFQQVLINLINNAEYAMREAKGGGTLSFRSRAVDGGRTIRLEVADSGPGIPNDHLPRIFESFFTTKPEGLGTGLGLSICREIVGAHAGKMWAENRPDGGALFIMEIPVLCEEERIRDTSKIERRYRRPGGLQGKRALVVDDEENIRELLKSLLTMEGMAVDIAGDGVAALEMIRKGEYDIVLSDVKMPKLDGKELMARIKEVRPALARRVIYITGSLLCARTRQFIDDAGCEYIQKPFDINNLLAKVQERIDVEIP